MRWSEYLLALVRDRGEGGSGGLAQPCNLCIVRHLLWENIHCDIEDPLLQALSKLYHFPSSQMSTRKLNTRTLSTLDQVSFDSPRLWLYWPRLSLQAPLTSSTSCHGYWTSSLFSESSSLVSPLTLAMLGRPEIGHTGPSRIIDEFDGWECTDCWRILIAGLYDLLTSVSAQDAFSFCLLSLFTKLFLLFLHCNM